MKTIPTISVEAQALLRRLLQCSIGQTVSYEELSTIVGRDVQGEGYGSLATARRRAQRDNGLVFKCVRGVGLKCCDDHEIVDSLRATPRRLRRVAARASREAVCVKDFDKLSREDQLAHNGLLAALGVVAHVTAPKSLNKISSKCAEQGAVIPPRKMLEFFQG